MKRVVAAIAIVGASALLPSCGSNGTDRQRTTTTEGTPVSAQVLEASGFTSTEGLEVIASSEERGIDSLLRFALRGSPEALDRALDAAEFSPSWSPGVTVHQTPLEAVALDELQDPQTGRDRWTRDDGTTLERVAVRGTDPGGDQVVHVWAFTT